MAMERAVVRRVADGEFGQILDLLAANELPQDGLAEHMATTLVAESGGRVLGSAALELYGRSALLRSVAVDATARDRGLGRQLTEAALALARELSVTRVYLLTDTARDYFPRFGFHTVGRNTVDAAVAKSAEFATLCPQSATVMVVEL